MTQAPFPATATTATDRRTLFKGAAGGIGLFLAFQYVVALIQLAGGSGGMDNKFSQLAREDYLGFVIGQNLLVLIAYAILFGLGLLLVIPALAVIRKRIKWRGRGSAVIPAFLITVLIHGYFMLRMIENRPYFLDDAKFGRWYYAILNAPPESMRPAVNVVLFGVLPWVVLVAVAGWWLMRFKPKTRIAVVLLAAAAAGSVAFAIKPSGASVKAAGDTKRPNIIVIGSDSLRGDRLGYSGYKPARSEGAGADGVSPNIDEWAKGAVRFERCYTPIASTLESAVSVMSSTYPHTHGIRYMYPEPKQVEATEASIRTIGGVLSDKGYDTAAIGDWCAGYYQMMPLDFHEIAVSDFDNFRIYMSQAVFMAHFVVPLYFDNRAGYQIFPQIHSFAQFVTPEVVTRRVEDKLAAQAKSGRPFFWHVFYSCNHLPYRCAEPYNTMFADPAYEGKHRTGVAFDINEFVKGTQMEDKLSALPEADVRQIRALYDGCTRQFDTCFSRIREALRKNGLEDNTIVVVTADHGDDLYEPGVTLTHGMGFNGADHCSHIPMAIRAPGIYGAAIPEQIRSIDLAPTLLDLAGAEIPAKWEGKSVAGWMRGADKPADRPFFAETSLPWIQFTVAGADRPKLPGVEDMVTVDANYNYQFVVLPKYEQPIIDAKQRCLRTRDWKIVCTPCSDGSRHFGLFHIKEDPDSRHDLAAERPEILAPMQKAMEDWIDDHVETPITGIFPAGEP
ncbi:sulfatase [Luteolibacter sp. Populi]|uniref:sulfatase family protein n=1 Tax=Luteolibacter sp. Populi TaxID=3230487 RepID=UPI003466F954